MVMSSSYIDSPRSGAAASETAAGRPGARPPAQQLPLAIGRRQVRIRGLAVAPGLWAALAVAAWLSPNPTGVGTHDQLGLPACGFLAQTGWPCPSCGLTTSLAAMAHGKFLLAWRAQPFGIVLFFACAAVAIAATAEALTGRSFLQLLRPGVWWVWAGVIALLAGWGLKVLIGVSNGTLPMR